MCIQNFLRVQYIQTSWAWLYYNALYTIYKFYNPTKKKIKDYIHIFMHAYKLMY